MTTLLARGVGVAKCGDDAHLRGAAHICVGTLALWREGALPDEPVGGLLPLPQLVEAGVAEVRGVLRALVLLREERAFQKDSLDASLGRAVRALLHGLRDAGARLVDSVSRCGQGSCKDGRGPFVRKSIKNLTITVWVTVHEVVVCVTVYVSVDEARRHGGVATVDHLEIWRGGIRNTYDDSIAHFQKATGTEACGKEQPASLEGEAVACQFPAPPEYVIKPSRCSACPPGGKGAWPSIPTRQAAATSLRKHTMADVTLRIVIANGTQDIAWRCDKGAWRYKKEPAANCVATGSPSYRLAECVLLPMPRRTWP